LRYCRFDSAGETAREVKGLANLPRLQRYRGIEPGLLPYHMSLQGGILLPLRRSLEALHMPAMG